MRRATFNVLFYIKRTKLLKNGNAPVYLKITVNVKSAEISLKRNIPINLWNTEKNQAKGKTQEAIDLNNYLNSVRGQLFIHQQNLQEDGKAITAKTLRNAFLGLGEKQWHLVELFTKHNQEMASLVNKDYSPLTLQRYEAALKHIIKFCKVSYMTNDINLGSVDHKFITGFELYLKTNAGCQHNSAMKHIKALRKIIGRALANEYLKKDPFSKYQITIRNKERETLTKTELTNIYNKKIDIERLDIIRDLFIFQCYTGLAFKDLETLQESHLKLGIDGNQWIFKKREKTDVSCHIPVLPIAKEILFKYQNHPCRKIQGKLLPVPSNQKMNAYLKEIATICGVNKKLHTHLARHTFATTVTLSNGIPIETVSKLLGHTKIQTTQIYAKVLDDKISQDMAVLQKKLA